MYYNYVSSGSVGTWASRGDEGKEGYLPILFITIRLLITSSSVRIIFIGEIGIRSPCYTTGAGGLATFCKFGDIGPVAWAFYIVTLY